MQSILPARVRQRVKHLGLKLRAPACEKLAEYITLLAQANTRMNLVSRDSGRPEAILDRHVLDSLRASALLLGRREADVGSGAGLPGIPLAIARPECEFTLIERSARRCDFLRHMQMRLDLANVRVEEADVHGSRLATPFDTVVARAFAPPERALAALGNLVAADGRILLFVGARGGEAGSRTRQPDPVPAGSASVVFLRPGAEFWTGAS